MAFNYFFEVNEKENLDLNHRVDPDSKCEKLYKDFNSLFFQGKLPNDETIDGVKIVERHNDKGESYWETVVNVGSGRIGLGMDYIGPSIYWAQKAGLRDEEILGFISISRTIGGHLIWPRWIYDGEKYVKDLSSINMARGGEDGVFDRIDFTLLYLKLWYEGEHKDNRVFSAFDSNRIWLEKFVDFDSFIDYFKLDGFANNLSSFDFDNTTYDELQADSKVFIPDSKEEYERYVEGCNYLISARTSALL